MIWVAILIILSSLSAAKDSPKGDSRNREVSVMTRNLDAGSDFGYVLAAASNPGTTDLQLLMAITNTYKEMIMSNIPGRADGIADEIRRRQPELVGLQEVTTLRTGVYGQPADKVVVDGLKSLLAALNKQGLHYRAIAVQTNAVVDLPAFDSTGALITVGFTDFDVVLARTDLPTSEFRVSDITMQHYSVYLAFTVAGETIPFLRGWISLQVKDRGKEFKFVTTLLETFSPDVQAAQANELIAGPLTTDLPVILAGDLNSDANQPSWDNGPAFQILEAAGMQEVWSKLHPLNSGLTWPLFAEDPTGPTTPRQRIDLILTKGQGIAAKRVMRTGLVPFQGNYASDHAGVFGQFVLPR